MNGPRAISSVRIADTSSSASRAWMTSGSPLSRAAAMWAFRNSDEIRDIARGVPHDRLLVETDAPYLAPVPHGSACGRSPQLCAAALSNRR
jgi:Tat protein secretion system quality control protein TatD with DNase activity